LDFENENKKENNKPTYEIISKTKQQSEMKKRIWELITNLCHEGGGEEEIAKPAFRLFINTITIDLNRNIFFFSLPISSHRFFVC
jgi:hypothetical protein